MGEILQAFALALPSVLINSAIDCETSAFVMLKYLSLLYPFYYILLFIPRQMDDDVVCRQKYGESWAEYERLVPWRICPGVW